MSITNAIAFLDSILDGIQDCNNREEARVILATAIVAPKPESALLEQIQDIAETGNDG